MTPYTETLGVMVLYTMPKVTKGFVDQVQHNNHDVGHAKNATPIRCCPQQEKYSKLASLSFGIHLLPRLVSQYAPVPQRFTYMYIYILKARG